MESTAGFFPWLFLASKLASGGHLLYYLITSQQNFIEEKTPFHYKTLMSSGILPLHFSNIWSKMLM